MAGDTVMAETKMDVWRRKVRNGLRKQAAAVQKEREKIWDILKEDPYKKPAINYTDADRVFSITRGFKKGELVVFHASRGTGKSFYQYTKEPYVFIADEY